MAATKTTPSLSGEIAVPPAGMLSIAGYARRYFPDVEFMLRDFGAERIPFDEQVREVIAINPDIIGMAARSFIYPATIRLAEAIKGLLPRVKIIFGGHHPSLILENDTYPDCFDSVVFHEGEKAFVELMKMHEQEIPWPKTYSCQYLDDLSHDYAWDIIKHPEAYARFYSPFNTDPLGSVVWSRGCPYNCLFCSGPALWKGSAPRVRYRTPASVANELEYIFKHFHVRRFFAHDDTINASINKLVPILEEIIRRKLKMTWGAAGMRANKAMTPEFIFKLMHQAGCRYVSFGIESGDPFVTDKLNRNVSFDDIERALTLARKYGLRTCAGFTVGHIWRNDDRSLGGETEENVQKTLDYIRYLLKKRLLWSIQFSVIDPIPGSELWNIALEHDLLHNRDWESLLTYDRVKLSFSHPNLTPDAIDSYYREVYKLVALSPRHMLFLLSTVRSFRDLYGLVRTGVFVLRKRIFGAE